MVGGFIDDVFQSKEIKASAQSGCQACPGYHPTNHLRPLILLLLSGRLLKSKTESYQSGHMRALLELVTACMDVRRPYPLSNVVQSPIV